MADSYDAILQAAQGYAKQRAATDPWNFGASAVQAIPQGNFDNPWTNIGIGMLKGFGSGYMGGMAQNNQNQALGDAYTQLVGSLQGQAVTDPALAPYAQQVQIARAGEYQDSLQDAMKFIGQENYKADLQRQNKMFEMGYDPAEFSGMPAAAKSPLQEGMTPGEQGGISKEEILKDLAGVPSSAEDAVTEKPKEPYVAKDNYVEQAINPFKQERLKKEFKDQFEGENKLRDEFKADPINKAYEISAIGFKSLANAFKDPSSTSDLELIRGAIQAIEPGMAVREGEQAAVQNSGSIPETLKAAALKAWRGESSLSPEQRAGIMRIAARRYSEYANAFDTNRQKYTSLAQNYKFKPENIVLGDAPIAVEKIFPEYSVPGSQPMPQAQPTQQMTPQKMGLNEFLMWKKQQGL